MKASPKLAPDLDAALKQNPSALRAFERLPPSHRREYLDWLAEAKKQETRQRRIGKMLERLVTGTHGQA